MPSRWRSLWRSRGQPSHAGQTSLEYQPIILSHRYVVSVFAFLITVDLIEIVGVLCYQLFTASYFPWHLYPLMLNRAVELVVLLCSHGPITSVYSLAQVFLSLLSLAVYLKKQPCGMYNCAAPLVLYSILLCYEIFVTIIVLKVSRMPMADDDGHIIANWPAGQVTPVPDLEDQAGRPLGIQIIGLSSRAMRARIISQFVSPDGEGASGGIHEKAMSINESGEFILAVQQPDGRKLAIARLCKELSVPELESDSSGISDITSEALPTPDEAYPPVQSSAKEAQQASAEHVGGTPIGKGDAQRGSSEEEETGEVMATERAPPPSPTPSSVKQAASFSSSSSIMSPDQAASSSFPFPSSCSSSSSFPPASEQTTAVSSQQASSFSPPPSAQDFSSPDETVSSSNQAAAFSPPSSAQDSSSSDQAVSSSNEASSFAPSSSCFVQASSLSELVVSSPSSSPSPLSTSSNTQSLTP